MKQAFFFSFTFSIILLSFLVAPTSFAVSPASPVPSPAAATSSAQNPADNVQALKDLVRQKGSDMVKGLMDQIGTQQRGFIGEVQRVTDKTLTVKDFKGNEILSVTSDVAVLKDGKKSSIDDIAVGDWVTAVGTTDKETFTLKELLISTTSLMPNTFITTLATVNTVTRNQLTATSRKSTDIVTYLTDRNTLYQDNQGNKVDPKTIKPDFLYLLIGYQNDTGNVLTTIRTLNN